MINMVMMNLLNHLLLLLLLTKILSRKILDHNIQNNNLIIGIFHNLTCQNFRIETKNFLMIGALVNFLFKKLSKYLNKLLKMTLAKIEILINK